jgi:peptide/nickel transport system substrate-binding protein
VRAGLAGAAVLTLLLTACSGGGDDPDSSEGTTGVSEAQTLIAYTGQAGDYQVNFNPYSPSNIGGRGTIYEPLFFFNKAQVSDPVPLLGTEYSWNDDGTVLSVTLREGVSWSDGEAFTAEDVAFTLNMLVDTPAINNIGFDGTTEVVDDTHLTITFDAPAFVKAPDILGQYIVPEHLWADINPTEDVVEQPIGTGAYLLDNFKPQAFTLVANEDYWDGAPDLKAIRWLSLSGNQAGADALAAGDIDWQTGPVPNIQDVAANYPGYDSLTANQSQMVLATCSSVEQGCTGPQTDPAVRHALYLAMNRDQLNNLAFQGTASEISPTFALVPSQEQWISDTITDPVAEGSADADAAAAVLEDAGYAKGSDGIYAKDGQRVSLNVEVVTGWTDYITAIDTMAQQLKTAGIDVTAAQSSWNEWTDKKSKGTYELAIDSLGQGASSDPYYLYNNFFSTANTAKVGESAPVNVSRFSDPAVDDALAVLKRTNPADVEARQEQFDIIQGAIVDDMPYIPILTGGTTSEFHADKFTGWPTADDLYAFPAIWASPDNAQIFKALKPAGE